MSRRPFARVLILMALQVMLPAAAGHAADGPATGTRCMVATAEPHATMAALEVLRDGGNAFDAAVTAALVLGVTEPYSSGLGGGGFVVGFRQQDGHAFALDCRETAPAAAARDMFLGPDGHADPALSRTGALSVAVPGLARGLADLHARHGRAPWPRLVQPAVDLARQGCPVHVMLADRLRSHHRRGRLDAAFLDVFAPDGRLPDVGDTLRQPDLAATLEALADHGADAFYTGAVAHRLAAAVQTGGGLLTVADLAAYRAVWREPVRGAYRGLDVVSMPPPSSGGVHLVQMLNILEPFDLAAAGYGSADAWHPVLEAMKLAFADRSRFLGDPDFVDVPADWLTGRAHADSQRALILPDTVIDPGRLVGAAAPAESQHTTHFSIVDPEGNAVAATLTINLGFGSGMIAPGTGVILNDEMDDFAAEPGTPNAFGLVQGERNAVGAGRRPLSSMTPTVVVRDGAVYMVTGSPGGSRIITSTLQTILHVVDFGMDARQAAAAPRVHHQWSPAHGWYEHYGMAPEVRRDLARRGHDLRPRGAMGNVQVIVRDGDGWTGASDPRGVGLAAGF